MSPSAEKNRSDTNMDRYYRLTQHPLLTEKGSDDIHQRNAYHFRVPADAGKVEIRQAVQKVFNVRVNSVNTVHVRGKVRRRGYAVGAKPDWKKAIVTLHPEDALDVF
ncbi:MAG: 50S ribosomal protein L23 [Planctomycetes bacterium]|nr:50S ribosomal protein L23 [Planctomycetota bacterium]HRV80564.1 50S ribosomal protein L23 [Planctomycetota bacterium]